MKSINKLLLASLFSVLRLLAVSVYGQAHKYYIRGSVVIILAATIVLAVFGLAAGEISSVSAQGVSDPPQATQEKPLNEEQVGELLDRLKEGLPKLIADEKAVEAIFEEWDTHEDLPGKTRLQILNILMKDVNSVIHDEDAAKDIWAEWQAQLGQNPVTHTVTRPRNCVLVLSSKSASLTAFGTTTKGFVPLTSQTFTVTPTVTPALAGSHACDGVTWTATSSTAGSTLPWLTVTRGASGAGPDPGTVSFQAMSNPQTADRTATITVTVTSSGSSPVAVPSPLTFAVNEAGDTGEILLQRQVRAMYQAILGRDPDGGGFGFWTGQGSSGLGQMVDSSMTSPGAVDTDWATMLAYQAAVNAEPTFAQYSVAVVNLRTGAQTPTGLLTSLNPTLTTTNVYKNLLGRNPVDAEGSQTPAGAYVTIIASAEFQNTGTFRTATDHTNGLYIRLLYFLTLNRDPDQGGYNFWVNQANALSSGLFYNGPPAARLTILGTGALNNGFVGSPAFQQRFQ